MIKSIKIKYEMTIAWSEEDDCYLVGFPDFPNQTWRTHGNTYKTAVNNGVEALESLMIAYEASGESLPKPKPSLYRFVSIDSNAFRNKIEIKSIK